MGTQFPVRERNEQLCISDPPMRVLYPHAVLWPGHGL